MLCVIFFPMLKVWCLCTSSIQSICVVHNMVIFFFSSLISCFPIMLVRHFLNDFEMVSVDPIITGIIFVFTFHMHYISIVRSSYFTIFWAYFLTIFLPLEISTSIDIHVPFSLFRIIMSSLCGCVRLHFLLFVTTNFSNCAYQCSLSDFTPISFNMLQCSSAHTLSCLMCTGLLPVMSMVILCVLLSHQIVDITCIFYLFLFVIFLLHDILFVMPDLVLLLFHFQFLLSDLPCTAIGT